MLSQRHAVGNQPCWVANWLTLLLTGQWTNKCSINSTSWRQSGQTGSSGIPLWSRVPRTGRAWWKSCQRKTWIFGIVSIVQIHLWAQSGFFNGWDLWASQVADLVVNSPVLSRRQHMVSSISVDGISIPWILWIMVCSGMTWDSLDIFHCRCGVMNSATVTEGWDRSSAWTCNSSRRLQLSSQLSNQKEIRCPLPSFQRMPCASNWRLLSKLFQTGESEPFLIYWKNSQWARYLVLKHWT